jgi:hypothetical protein
MRWVTTVVALAALAALAVVWRWHVRTPAPASRERDSSEELADLRREVAALRAEVQRQRLAASALSRLTAPDAAPVVAPRLRPEERVADPERAEETTAAVAARFGAEGTDPAWSRPAAARIEEELRQAGLGEAVRGVSCATTMCQVKLQIEDEEVRERLAQRLVELPSFRTQVLYQHHPDSKPPGLTLFVARDGHALPLGSGRSD